MSPAPSALYRRHTGGTAAALYATSTKRGSSFCYCTVFLSVLSPFSETTWSRGTEDASGVSCHVKFLACGSNWEYKARVGYEAERPDTLMGSDRPGCGLQRCRDACNVRAFHLRGAGWCIGGRVFPYSKNAELVNTGRMDFSVSFDTEC